MAKAAVVSSSNVEAMKKKESAAGANVVRLAVSLQNGIKFTGIYSAPDECVVLPGINEHLRGSAHGGILGDAGASVYVTVPRDQWEEVKAKYGAAHVFDPTNPFIRELKSDADYKAMQDELSEVRTGGEPNSQAELDKLLKAK